MHISSLRAKAGSENDNLRGDQSMVRKARRASQSQELPAFLKQIHLNAAGIDVGSENHYVAVPVDRDKESVRTFPAFTPDLECLADWLKACGVDTVAMESTGVYWIPMANMVRKAKELGYGLVKSETVA
jgi:hypothetical protein